VRRREFIAGFGCIALLPIPVIAQQAIPVIGVLSSGSSRDYVPMFAIFRKALGEIGYIDGQNVRIDYVWADEHYDRLPALATSLISRQVNVLVAASTPAALALKPATATIPIVFAIGGDPVRTGLVESLSRPGGNLTGAAHINVETAPKRLELLHELLPAEKIMGLLVNPANPMAKPVSEEVHTAAGALGLELRVVRAQNDDDIEAAFAELHATKVGALVIGTDPLFTSRAEKLGELSLRSGLPAIYQYREFTAAGGVMSYGGNIMDSYYRAGLYAGRILKGEKPSDLPVQLSTKVELFLNLKSARQLGPSVPLPLIGRADEVIE
jgi:putative ABC transport system substrate-binding protein